MHLLLPFFLASGVAYAHTTFTNFFINGKPQGDGTCVRMSHTPQNATFPLPNITAPEMACGTDGNIGVAHVCAAPAGGILTFEFREWPDGSHPGSIDPSHKGPLAVYMKHVDDATMNGTATGPGWFKIYQAAYNATRRTWATETLIANGGRLSVTLPRDIVGGHYLVRTELLALHAADKTPPDPQFYVGCAQIFLHGNGTVAPRATVGIPGHVSLDTDHAALTFNIYAEPLNLPYPMLGPPVYAAEPVSHVPPATEQQTAGLWPADCVLRGANWCGHELDAYTNATGCWNASKACWTQSAACYAAAPPTGSAHCRLWEAKCKGIQAACAAGNVHGPPDASHDLTPPLASPSSLPPPANGAILAAGVSAAASTGPDGPVLSLSTAPATAAPAASSSTNPNGPVLSSLTASAAGPDAPILTGYTTVTATTTVAAAAVTTSSTFADERTRTVFMTVTVPATAPPDECTDTETTAAAASVMAASTAEATTTIVRTHRRTKFVTVPVPARSRADTCTDAEVASVTVVPIAPE